MLESIVNANVFIRMFVFIVFICCMYFTFHVMLFSFLQNSLKKDAASSYYFVNLVFFIVALVVFNILFLPVIIFSPHGDVSIFFVALAFVFCFGLFYILFIGSQKQQDFSSPQPIDDSIFPEDPFENM